LDPERLRNQEGRIWLNIASSREVLPGFVNLDNSIYLRVLPVASWVRPFLDPGHREWLDAYRDARSRALLVRHDCRKPLTLPDGCVDHVLCSHFLEHVHPDECQRILADLHRVLRRGGTAHVIVPDLAVLVDEYQKNRGNRDASDHFVRETYLSRDSRGSLRFRLMEFLGSFGLNHRWMYDGAAIAHRVAEAGFDLLDRNDTPSAAYRRDDGISVHVVGVKR
jgi:predicted SAM-dependent methyltransferase